MARNRLTAALAALLITIGSSVATAETYYLNVNLKSGATETYALADKPVIAFPDLNTMEIKGDGFGATYAIAEIADYAFSQSSSIKSAVADSYEVRYLSADCLEVAGADALTVNVYTASGTLAKSVKAAKGETAAVSFAELGKGIYIVSINNKKNIKILKK